MKQLRYLSIIIFSLLCFASCDEEAEQEEEMPMRTNHLVTFNNNRGISGCFPAYDVVFIVSYRDVQASIELGAPNTGFLNVFVEDDESINVVVQRKSNDEVVANANVNVRTTSRPESLENEPRTVSFCRAFDLQFQNF